MIDALIVAAVLTLPARAALPENPCELITAADIAVVGQLVVEPGRRVPSKLQIIAAERERREPAPGTICVFESGVEFGGPSRVHGVLFRGSARTRGFPVARP